MIADLMLFMQIHNVTDDFPKQIRALSSVSSSSVSAIWGVVHEKRGETEGVCHRFEMLLSSALRGVFCCQAKEKIFPRQGEILGASDDDDTDDSGVIYFCRSGAIY